MLIKACLNGFREPGAHPMLPLSADELARDAVLVVASGARALHIHPRDSAGRQSLHASDQAAALSAIRAHCPGIPIGVSTAYLIEPGAILQRVSEWTVLPDFASVNFDEPDIANLCRALLERGIGIEAGLVNEAGVELLHQLGLAEDCLRVLIELGEPEPAEALAVTTGIIRALDRRHIHAPRLLHGSDDTTWPILEAAIHYGYDTRIGLEDTLLLPDGNLAAGNADLVALAVSKAVRA